MIERVARAIYAREYKDLSRPYPNWQACIGAARAAIEAMRTPTEAMKIAAREECATTDLATDDDFEDQYGEVWDTMIDAALHTSSGTSSSSSQSSSVGK